MWRYNGRVRWGCGSSARIVTSLLMAISLATLSRHYNKLKVNARIKIVHGLRWENPICVSSVLIKASICYRAAFASDKTIYFILYFIGKLTATQLISYCVSDCWVLWITFALTKRYKTLGKRGTRQENPLCQINNSKYREPLRFKSRLPRATGPPSNLFIVCTITMFIY